MLDAGGGGGGGGGDGSFWTCASECARQTKAWIDGGWPRESLLVFGAGWEFMNMNRVVELSAQDRTTIGRAYSCATSNVGVYAHPTSHGGTSIDQIFFGISQTVSAPAISVSTVTVDGKLCLSLAYCRPIWQVPHLAQDERAGSLGIPRPPAPPAYSPH